MFVLKAIIVLSVLLLLLYFVALLSGYRPFVNTAAGTKALVEMEGLTKSANDLMNAHKKTMDKIARDLSYAIREEQVVQVLSQYVGSSSFGDLHYFYQGIEYSSTGLRVNSDRYSPAYQLAQRNQPGCTDLYHNEAVGMDCVSMYVPVPGSHVADGILAIIPARNIIDLSEIRPDAVKVSALVSRDGTVLTHNIAPDFLGHMETNISKFIKIITQNKESANTVQEMIKKSLPESCQIMMGGVTYTVAFCPLASTDFHLRLVNMWVSTDLTSTELNFIRQIVVVSVVSVFALLVSLFFAFLFHNRVTKMLIRATQIAPELGCPNSAQFRRRTGEILSGSDSRNWYVISAEVKQFTYILNQYGRDMVLEQLKFIVKVLSGSCEGREFFAYGEDGIFLILLYCKDENTFHNRVKVMTELIGKSDLMKAKGVVSGLYVGAYGVGTHRDLPIGEILEYASSARTMSKSDVHKPYILYTDEIRDELMRNNRIEAQMEEALATGEFKLFLQPKYNVKRDCVDSAEALVRWYDPRRNDYIFPVEFIPLFESNGFVTKLDHFMYLEVCKYFKSAAERGAKIIPIAVNVSRVTAMRPDFLDFYIGNKEKYGIADGFLTVEMTESFAMQNYEALERLVTELHKHGIKCSIDDFGSGYSSFEVLKKIPLDELKMDRVFIADGINTEKDALLVQTVINLGTSMGMSVVQEGVETREMFDTICSMGCDVIQGYYYARAIPLEEFRIFINTNTSIRYKARVK